MACWVKQMRTKASRAARRTAGGHILYTPIFGLALTRTPAVVQVYSRVEPGGRK